jgi:hypothetical protein
LLNSNGRQQVSRTFRKPTDPHAQMPMVRLRNPGRCISPPGHGPYLRRRHYASLGPNIKVQARESDSRPRALPPYYYTFDSREIRRHVDRCTSEKSGQLVKSEFFSNACTKPPF